MIRVYANLPTAVGTIYAIAQDAGGAIFNGSGFDDPPAPWSNAVIALTRAGERVHADLPDGTVTWDIRRQAGGSPASTDRAIWFGEVTPAIDIPPPSQGNGDIAVDHNTGGTDILRALEADEVTGVDDMLITAYLAADYAAGSFTPRAQVRTGSDGRWIAPMMLDAGTYKLVYSKPGRQTVVGEVTVA